MGQGARLVTGGERQGAVFAPTIVADVTSKMRISCEELFGPAVGVTAIRNIDEAIALANDTPYGLSAGLFTKDLNNAFHFARSVHSGNVMINWSPLWRADLMPYGGFKQSGIGKEGPRYAVQEMTDVNSRFPWAFFDAHFGLAGYERPCFFEFVVGSRAAGQFAGSAHGDKVHWCSK